MQNNIEVQNQEKKKILKEAILAGVFCWLLTLILYSLYNIIARLIYLSKEVNYTGNIIEFFNDFFGSLPEWEVFWLFLINSPFILLFLIIGFYFGMKKYLEQNKKIFPIFQIFIFWLIGVIILPMILGICMAISLIFKHSNIIEIFKVLLLPLLIFVPFESELGFEPLVMLVPYLIAIPLTWFLIKKDLISILSKGIVIFSFVLLALFILMGTNRVFYLKEYHALENTFKSDEKIAAVTGNLDLCEKIKEMTKKHPYKASFLNWRDDYTYCIKEVAVNKKDETICEKLDELKYIHWIEWDYSVEKNINHEIAECKNRIFVAKFDQKDLPESCKINLETNIPFETIPEGTYLQHCLKDIAIKTKNPEICKKLLELNNQEFYEECYERIMNETKIYGWQAYRNEELGIEFQYPKSWGEIKETQFQGPTECQPYERIVEGTKIVLNFIESTGVVNSYISIYVTSANYKSAICFINEEKIKPGLVTEKDLKCESYPVGISKVIGCEKTSIDNSPAIEWYMGVVDIGTCTYYIEKHIQIISPNQKFPGVYIVAKIVGLDYEGKCEKTHRENSKMSFEDFVNIRSRQLKENDLPFETRQFLEDLNTFIKSFRFIK